jgi:hypothetical protein
MPIRAQGIIEAGVGPGTFRAAAALHVRVWLDEAGATRLELRSRRRGGGLGLDGARRGAVRFRRLLERELGRAFDPQLQ